MPLTTLSAQALSGSSSSSRKRSHAEITRSESRSRSPQPPFKRRRTIDSPHNERNLLSLESPTYLPDSRRYPGDGFDYRRPAVLTRMDSEESGEQVVQHLIDLTQDDDSPPPPLPFSSHATSTSRHRTQLGTPSIQPSMRAPPFRPHHDEFQDQSVIDLSSDDEEEDATSVQGDGGTRLVPSSPEVQFMGERTLPRPPNAQHQSQRRPHLPTPPAMGHFGSMVNFVRDMTQNYFANFRGSRELPEEALNRIDGLLNHSALARGPFDPPPDAFADEYDGLQMDYGRAAFNVGGDILLIEDPTLHNVVPNRPNESAYKEPAAAREGFTRNYEEDDMLICGFCGDELATGTTEQKQQVWIIKQCGHAYCGDCAHNRNISKSRNNRDTKRQASKKYNAFRTCTVPGCSKAVDSKTKMFQIYL